MRCNPSRTGEAGTVQLQADDMCGIDAEGNENRREATVAKKSQGYLSDYERSRP